MHTRRLTALLLSAVSLLVGPPAVAATPAAPRPNVILIMADDLGFSDLGSYGGEVATPHLDRLAREGLRFTQFYNTSRCCPTRAALMTGLYPHQAGVGHMIDAYAAARRAAFNSPAYSDRLSPHTPTIAEALRPAGYRTLMVGKWHLGYRPAEWPVARGFDRSFVQIEGAMNYWGYGPQGALPQGERGFGPMALDAQPYTPPLEGFFTTDAYTDHAIDFIREARRGGSPFFLYFAHNAPHWPLHARPATIAKYRGKYRAGWDRLRAARYEKMKQLGAIDAKWPLAPRPENLSAWDALPADKQDTWDLWMAVYAAQIEEMDTSVGRLLAALRDTGADQNTLVLFFSDNGGAAERPVKTLGGAALGTRDSYEGYAVDGAHLSSAPFRKTKKYTHEGGISSPCIAWWPAGIPADRRGQWLTTPGHVIDLMPTCLELAGAAHPAEHGGGRTTPLAGISLASLFAGRAVTRPQPLFWEHEGHRAVRDGNWKLVSTFGEPWELYDVVADRTELNNLAATFPDRVRDLSARYDAWAKSAGVLPWTNLPAAGKGGKKKQ